MDSTAFCIVVDGGDALLKHIDRTTFLYDGDVVIPSGRLVIWSCREGKCVIVVKGECMRFFKTVEWLVRVEPKSVLKGGLIRTRGVL